MKKSIASKLSLASAIVMAAVAVDAGAAQSASAVETGASYNNYIYFGGMYIRPDSSRGTASGANSFGQAAGFGHRLTNDLWLEGQFFGDTLQMPRGTNNSFQQGLGLDLVYAFGQRSEFTPFVLAGVSAVHNDIAAQGADRTTAAFDLGAGFTQAIFSDNLRFRAEARAVRDNFQGGKTDYRALAGLEFALGSKKPVEVEKVVIKEVPVEHEVIREVPVEKIVYKAPEPVAPVNVDDDGDGVINERDKCPNTLRGAKVDGNGCVVEQTMTIRDITFEFNSARLTANAQRLMENVVSFLRADPNVHLSISGHTDNKGSDSYNLKLSRARANEVRDYLIGYGIDGSRLEAAGYGESRPVASNDTDAGRELNRRVEFRIEK